MSYTAGPAVGETVQVLNETGAAVPVQLDRDLLFSADVFSQNEIEDSPQVRRSPPRAATLTRTFEFEADRHPVVST